VEVGPERLAEASLGELSAVLVLAAGTGWGQWTRPPPLSQAPTTAEQAKLTSNDAAPGDSFGESVSLSGDTTVVGAVQGNHAGGTDAGSAYVFVRNGASWTHGQRCRALRLLWPFCLPSFWPSTVAAESVKPLGAVALGVPLAESNAWQPLADVPAVQ